MKRLTKTARRRITADWASCFPELGVLAPMRLLRIAGPLLVGIALERDSSNECYIPTFHVHYLLRSFSTVSLSLAQPLKSVFRSAPESIRLISHESKYVEAAARLEVQAPISLAGPVSRGDIVKAYEFYLERSRLHELRVYEEFIGTTAWIYGAEEAAQLLEKVTETFMSWSDGSFARVNGLLAWRSSALEIINNREAMAQTLAEQLSFHKALHLPVVELI